ncbi:ATP-binding protein [Deinococcus koreensis]|uniref:ATP-binding protein n=1 Tax=Deinococcus koreensis TaxID=2054903 RepID=A0A2K3URL0_9DEIO|nr:ATP-binding protein [Deinococcus koreensis]
MALQLSQSLPDGSVGILYDCFGAGRYRSRSEPRHSHRAACLQIANELATRGLCEPLITGASNDMWMRALLQRLKVAVATLRRAQADAVLAVFVDAADNAEMAAQEFSESCFVHELLREAVPEGCRIIALCRTERRHLLQPKSTVSQIELRPFSEAESLRHLRTRFDDATAPEGQEFHRLSSKNPRVQANALSIRGDEATVESVLAGLGPSPTTVDQQIEQQLKFAVASVRDRLPAQHQDQIEAICRGLANLPPFIPIEVLAKAAGVEPELISSFASDLGRPLYLSESSVHFRDEPTETWFRQQFAASPDVIKQYTIRLNPLAEDIPYVASVLPSLLQQSGQYDELIQLALSDGSLPHNKPIDARNIRVYRLQYALKAALQRQRYKDAAKLAFRAGEETAGKERELELLTENLDLIPLLQSSERVQELAFRRMLRSGWAGSENVYSASLLSYVKEFQGDARSFRRSGSAWLTLHFEEREQKRKKKPHAYEDALKTRDIGEMAITNLNLDGSEDAVRFTVNWRPPSTIFKTTTFLARRLIDAGRFEVIEEFARAGRDSPLIVLALCNELVAVGRRPEVEVLRRCLAALVEEPSIIPTPELGGLDNGRDSFQSAVLALAESCAASGLAKKHVLHMLETRFAKGISRYIASWHSLDELWLFLRFLAIRAVLEQNLKPDLQQWLPEEWLSEKLGHEQRQQKEEFEEVFACLFPWYLARAQIIVDPANDPQTLLQRTEAHAKTGYRVGTSLHQQLPFEIARVRFECWTFARPTVEPGEGFAQGLLEGKFRLRLRDQLYALRASHRLEHLKGIRMPLEQSCRDAVQHSTEDTPEEMANLYVRLARAVLVTDYGDAAEYFRRALEAVSKFGDEVVDRWRALTAMAERTCEGGQTSPETAYRYIRCAELVGDSVVREKYWDRMEAIEVCFRLNAPSGFAALSRWRDRQVGYFDRLLPRLCQSAVDSGAVSPAAGWSLSAFSWEDGYLDFALLCIEREPDRANKQFILDTAVRDLRLQNHLGDWQKLGDAAQRFSLDATEVRQVLDFQVKPLVREGSDGLPNYPHLREEAEAVDWSTLLAGLDLSSSVGLNEAIQRFEATPYPHVRAAFWNEVFSRVPETNIKRLLEELLLAEKLDSHDVAEGIQSLPSQYRQKVSVQQHWPDLARGLGKRFAAECCVHWRRKRFVEALGSDPSYSKLICDGVVEGIADSNDLNGAGTLFGFCEVIASFVTSEEAHEVLGFAIGRFELHVMDAHADGPWKTSMEPPTSMVETLAGFLWSALGSPRAAERWQAAHGVRRLAATGCMLELDALVTWMAREDVGAFGSPSYPFYILHARLYLIIALSRVALDSAGLLKAHAALFEHHALTCEPHILIQKYAARTALSIEAAYPGTYPEQTIAALSAVGVSPFPLRKTKGYSDNTAQTPWHVRGEVDPTLDLYLGYDFDRYWFAPLDDVFGVQNGQTQQLACDLIFNRWKIKVNDRSIVDPRRGLWDQSHRERETWHSHMDYPNADNYTFYLSYHALLQSAGMMLSELPVVDKDYEDGENAWASWLQRHDLTRADGRWLADRRDPAPLKRPGWLRQAATDSWRDKAGADEADFIEGLLTGRNGRAWLCTDGRWEDGDRERNETFRVASALVAPSTAQSLLNALSTCLDPHDFKLPALDEDRLEFKSPPFELQGWITRHHTSNKLDDFDPHAGNIDYPPYTVASEILDRCGIVADQENRVWISSDGSEAVVCELWGEYKSQHGSEQDIRERKGSRMLASLAFLKTLCQTLDRVLIFEVQIQRTFLRSSYRRREDHDGYRSPANRIYLLSADGTLRTTSTGYQLRESVGAGT